MFTSMFFHCGVFASTGAVTATTSVVGRLFKALSCGMKRVALNGRTTVFAPIRTLVMLLSCWGVVLGDGREC
ncbi:hypothetical protein ACFX13_044070 [Malus domestica]